MGMAAIFFKGAKSFKQIEAIPFDRMLHVKSGENCSSDLREDI